jgi:hypothetical protein
MAALPDAIDDCLQTNAAVDLEWPPRAPSREKQRWRKRCENGELNANGSLLFYLPNYAAK